MAFLRTHGCLGFDLHIFYGNTPCWVYLPMQRHRKPISGTHGFSVQKQGFLDGFLGGELLSPATHRPLQKFSRALMTKRRLPVAVVIRPKLGELMLRFAAIGGVNCGVFSTLTESTRISNSLLSVILTRLIRFTSNPSSGGPSIHPSPRVPTCPG